MSHLTLPYIEAKQPSVLRKAVVGFACVFSVEIIFFLVGAICMLLMWWLFFHCLGRSDHQSTYIYYPYEVKYIWIVVGGYKKRVAIKKFYKVKILGQG